MLPEVFPRLQPLPFYLYSSKISINSFVFFAGSPEEIKKQGMKAGISIKPNTPVQTIENLLGKVDMVLIMTALTHNSYLIPLLFF